MGVLHYPPQTGQVDDRVIGIGAHTEWVSNSAHIYILTDIAIVGKQV